MNIRIQVASVHDRENLVAELWLEDVILAEVSREQDKFGVEIYASRVTLLLEDFVEALEKAKKELMI